MPPVCAATQKGGLADADGGFREVDPECAVPRGTSAVVLQRSMLCTVGIQLGGKSQQSCPLSTSLGFGTGLQEDVLNGVLRDLPR